MIMKTFTCFLVGTGLACVPVQPLNEHRAWKHSTEQTDHHYFIGLACGVDRLTLTAHTSAELHAIGCDVVGSIEEMCPQSDQLYDDEPVEAWECATYYGDGW